MIIASTIAVLGAGFLVIADRKPDWMSHSVERGLIGAGILLFLIAGYIAFLPVV